MDISRDSLRDALALVTKAAGSGSILPILTCVHLQADKSSLTLTANNLEIVIRTRVGVQVEASFSAAVPAAVLANIVSASDAETIELDFDDISLTMKLAS